MCNTEMERKFYQNSESDYFQKYLAPIEGYRFVKKDLDRFPIENKSKIYCLFLTWGHTQTT